ncbi:MAG TPA: hypothetical protein VIJ34_10325 [Acidimicrobiales bacterium]
MHRRSEGLSEVSPNAVDKDRSEVVVAGPGSSLTIPGIIVAEIVQAIGRLTSVTRIEVDTDTAFASGLHRAPSLAAAHDPILTGGAPRLTAPKTSRLRMQAFREWMGPDVQTVVAYAWPGIENDWIKQFIQAGKAAGACTIVAAASLPNAGSAGAELAEAVERADLVLVGDQSDANALNSEFGGSGPAVETHRALALRRRGARSELHQITAFLPKDNEETLSTVLAAFDAVPEAWIDRYHLTIVMRYGSSSIPGKIANSYHAQHVDLISDDMSELDLERLCANSSALSVAEPAFDSRAFSAAVDSGSAIAVLTSALPPEVGRGYVGGLLGDVKRPASVHVALAHALRLANLGFPPPDAWDDLAKRLKGGTSGKSADARFRRAVTHTR